MALLVTFSSWTTWPSWETVSGPELVSEQALALAPTGGDAIHAHATQLSSSHQNLLNLATKHMRQTSP